MAFKSPHPDVEIPEVPLHEFVLQKAASLGDKPALIDGPTGRTITYLMDNLRVRQPASLRICTLLSKPSRREVDLDIDYIGFEIPNEFVIGYGLDHAENYRNLPFIGVLKPEVYS